MASLGPLGVSKIIKTSLHLHLSRCIIKLSTKNPYLWCILNIKTNLCR